MSKVKEVESPFHDLMRKQAQEGTVSWIGLRPASRQPVNEVEEVVAKVGWGLEGDRFKSEGGKRQVSLIQAEHIESVASFLGKGEIDAGLLRRNIVVRGINLLSLKNYKFRIGTAVLEMTGLCHPCSRMEENLGKGGYNAMRGHGGIIAKVITEGVIKVGDSIVMILDD